MAARVTCTMRLSGGHNWFIFERDSAFSHDWTLRTMSHTTTWSKLFRTCGLWEFETLWASSLWLAALGFPCSCTITRTQGLSAQHRPYSYVLGLLSNVSSVSCPDCWVSSLHVWPKCHLTPQRMLIITARENLKHVRHVKHFAFSRHGGFKSHETHSLSIVPKFFFKRLLCSRFVLTRRSSLAQQFLSRTFRSCLKRRRISRGSTTYWCMIHRVWSILTGTALHCGAQYQS